MDVDEVQRWMSANCGVCRRVGDHHLWMDIRCRIPRRIVWGGPPYSEQDRALIGSYVELGDCARIVVDEERKRQREQEKLMRAQRAQTVNK